MNCECVDGCGRVGLPGKRVKIEFYDGSGVKHTIILDGDISRSKISQVLDYVELMGGASPEPLPQLRGRLDSKFERLKRLVLSEFIDKIFNSRDVQAAYLEAYGERIPLSTVSTYLSRLADRGLLNRGGSPGDWNYAVSHGGERAYSIGR
ncbi:MAG: hypothetical protein QW569_05290 [Candidatus Bathyarchaeia archaeon]|nr:hypothetical protein [Candidatus Bathyarchaeota archaeon]